MQGRYAKQHLVPFGEYVPWRSQLGFIKALEQVPRDFKPGDERVLFDVRGHRVASLICFESAFAPLVRDFVRDGAEVVVVSTNNRSYRRSSNAAQHVAQSQMRAAETGRPVLQASVSGISAVDRRLGGRPRDQPRCSDNGTISTVVTTMTGETPYVRFGDWVLSGSALALVVAAVVGRRRLLRTAAVPVESPRRRRRGEVRERRRQERAGARRRGVRVRAGRRGDVPARHRAVLPGLFVNRGRTEVNKYGKDAAKQVHQAKSMGEFAVTFGGPRLRRKLEEGMSAARRSAETVLTNLGSADGSPAINGDDRRVAGAARDPAPGARGSRAGTGDAGTGRGLRRLRARDPGLRRALGVAGRRAARGAAPRRARGGARLRGGEPGRRTILCKIDQLAG